MLKAIQDVGEGYILQYHQLRADSDDKEGDVEGLGAILEAYEDVFQETSGLPPKREHDHAIVLKEGAPIPNIRPYSHIQHLQVVLQVLREHHLFANKKKCNFGRSQLEYLGHLISRARVVADPTRVFGP